MKAKTLLAHSTCDVGVKSLVRSLALFYRRRLQCFTKHRSFSSRDKAVEEMVSTTLFNGTNTAACDDLVMAIRALLSASTTTLKVNLVKINRKKGLYQYTELPDRLKHNEDDFLKRTKNLSKLMYQIKKDSLREFLNDDANIFLLRFFAGNGGLATTTLNSKTMSQRPACR